MYETETDPSVNNVTDDSSTHSVCTEMIDMQLEVKYLSDSLANNIKTYQ